MSMCLLLTGVVGDAKPQAKSGSSAKVRQCSHLSGMTKENVLVERVRRVAGKCSPPTVRGIDCHVVMSHSGRRD